MKKKTITTMLQTGLFIFTAVLFASDMNGACDLVQTEKWDY